MLLSSDLLASLVDPEDHKPLFYIASQKLLYNPRLKRAYSVSKSGIAIMLSGDATTVDEAEHERLMKLVHRDELKPTGGGK